MSTASASADLTGPEDDLDLYREMLERQWRAQLHDVTRLSLELADAGAADPSDVTRRLLAAARVHLEETEAALRRLDQGRYGVCVGCHAPIPRARLEALPSAHLCVGCLQAFRAGRGGEATGRAGT